MSESETVLVTSNSSQNLAQNLKVEIDERPSSPESNCAICLEELHNKSYTNTCLHQFCFHCLLEWSKVKPECPLCKQVFSRIYHNIRSNEEYDEHVLEPPMPPPPPDPHIFINVAFQRHRFRSTMAGSMLWAFQGFNPMPLNTHNSWTSSHSYPVDYSVPTSTTRPIRLGGITTRSMARSQRQDEAAFNRRNVYRQGLWVRPGSVARFRECSPEFYRLNPAQTHRLVPWLTRELNVLMDMQYDVDTVCQDILNLISAHHINSSVFHRAMTFYLGSTAEHFIHEFYHFAISPHDMQTYDANAQYAQVGREFSSESDSDVEQLLPEPLVSLDLTAAPGPSGLQQQSTSNASGEPTNTSPNYLVIELSDDDDDDDNVNAESDSDVEIIGQLPPRHLRTPEVIDIATDSDNEILECDVKPKSEPSNLVTVSSGEDVDEDEPEDDEVEELVAAALQDVEEDVMPTLTYEPPTYQCPMYDNCPYSKDVARMAAQSRRSSTSFKRDRQRTYTVSSATSSSTCTDLDDNDISSNGRSSGSRQNKHTRSSDNKKSLKGNNTSANHETVPKCVRIVVKRKRPYDERNNSRTRHNRNNNNYDDQSSLTLTSSSSTSSSSSSSSQSSSSITTSPSPVDEEDTTFSSDDSCSSVKRKRRRPVRLKSIVLKVDKSNRKPTSPVIFSSTSAASSSSSGSIHYRRRRDSRISSSESED